MKAATVLVSVKKPFLLFQSTPPVKAATNLRLRDLSARNISIHAAREGGDDEELAAYADKIISIHAAREGGDAAFVQQMYDDRISIHAAREGGDKIA